MYFQTNQGPCPEGHELFPAGGRCNVAADRWQFSYSAPADHCGEFLFTYQVIDACGRSVSTGKCDQVISDPVILKLVLMSTTICGMALEPSNIRLSEGELFFTGQWVKPPPHSPGATRQI